MLNAHEPITIDDVTEALDALEDIPRPEGDNEGDPINAPAVYRGLSEENRELVDHAEEVVSAFTRQSGNEGDEPNKRKITALRKHGHDVSLNTDQYDPLRLVGRAKVGDWELDISDPETPET